MWSGAGGRGGLEPTWWATFGERIGLGGFAALLFLGFWLLSFWYSGLAIWGSAGMCFAPWACGWLWFAVRSLEKEAREYRADVRRLLAWDPDGKWRREYVELDLRVRLYRGPQLQWVRVWIVAALAVSGLLSEQSGNIVQGRAVVTRRWESFEDAGVTPAVKVKPFDVDSFLEKETGIKR